MIGTTIILLGGLLISLARTDVLVQKNANDIKGVNDYVTILSGRIDDLQIQSQSQKLGATITTINATDRITDSRSTINTNLANLNADKIEVATTSVGNITTLANLVTVGTLTSGSLGSGFTTVVVARGGTGSTTLSSNQVLLGNGTGNIGLVSGLGSSGQFLTSGGAGVAPTWTTSSIDLTANYSWTGNNNFAGAITNVRNLNASTTQIIGGVTLVYPSSQGASSTVLTNNGLGTLSWTYPTSYDGLVDPTTGTTTIKVLFGSFATNGLTGASNITFSPPATTTAEMATVNINNSEVSMTVTDSNFSNFTNSHDFLGSLKIRLKFSSLANAFNFFVGTGDIQNFQNINSKGMGFVVQEDQVFRCYANSGTASTTTVFSGVSPTYTQWNTFEIVKNSATSFSVLVNGITACTHSTNVPTGAYGSNVALSIDVRNLSATAASVYMMPGLIMKIHARGY